MSRRGLEVWRISGDPAPLAHDSILSFHLIKELIGIVSSVTSTTGYVRLKILIGTLFSALHSYGEILGFINMKETDNEQTELLSLLRSFHHFLLAYHCC